MSQHADTKASPTTLHQLEQARRSGMPAGQATSLVARTLHLPIASVRGGFFL
jgi:hypothetical protein